MTAQEKMIEYAKKYNTGTTLTNEEFCGQMVVKGVVINRTPGSKTIANAKREGKTIIVTETIKREVNSIVDGKIITTVEETTTEVMRIDL